jgi:NitT/TauT family transport system substrate-binding protein
MSKAWRRAVLAALTAALAGSAILFGLPDWKKRPKAPPFPLTLAIRQQPVSALLFIAAARDFFAEEGLDVSLQPHALGKDALSAVLAGKADMATAADTPIMQAILHGAPVDIVACHFTAEHNSAMLAVRESGITTFDDLRGRRIGAVFGTNSEYVLDILLSYHGLSRHDVEAVDVPPERMRTALLSGEVAAIATYNPFLYELTHELGEAALVFSAAELYTESSCLVGADAFVRAHTKQLEALLRALRRAEVFAERQPRQAQEITARSLGVGTEQISELWSSFHLSVDLDQSLLQVLEHQARWQLASQGLAGEPPNFLRHLALDPLTHVAPDVVSVIH